MRYLWIALLVTLSLLVQAAENVSENLYAKHYRPQNTGGLVSLQASPNTELLRGENKQQDNISMLERGYDLMGSTGFDAGDVPPEQALTHGKQIGADTVLVYMRQSRKASPIGQMEFIREARKSGKELTEQDLKEQPLYSYYATYWAKLPTPILGVHVIKLVPKDEEVAPDKGVNVIAVIQGSPAARAGLQRGDVLLRIGDIALQKPEELAAAVRQYQGNAVQITYARDGEPQAVTVTLNAR